MKETLLRPVQVQALRGVNQSTTERPDEFATLQNLVPDQMGRQTRMLGKALIEKRTSPVMTIHQFWTAYGYGSRLSQTDGGVITDPEPPLDPGIHEPHIDYPLNCKPVKAYSNKLKLQYIDRRSDFIHLRFRWNLCAGVNFDSRVSLDQCSIAGVPVFDGVTTNAIVGSFKIAGVPSAVLDFDHAGKNILSFAANNTKTFEDAIINLSSLREIAGNVAFTAKFTLKGYFYDYLDPVKGGNVVVYIYPKERGKFGSYVRYPILSEPGSAGFVFYNTKNYRRKSVKRHITTQNNNPTVGAGDLICYLYVKFNPKAQAAKDRIWIDDA